MIIGFYPEGMQLFVGALSLASQVQGMTTFLVLSLSLYLNLSVFYNDIITKSIKLNIVRLSR